VSKPRNLCLTPARSTLFQTLRNPLPKHVCRQVQLLKIFFPREVAFYLAYPPPKPPNLKRQKCTQSCLLLWLLDPLDFLQLHLEYILRIQNIGIFILSLTARLHPLPSSSRPLPAPSSFPSASCRHRLPYSSSFDVVFSQMSFSYSSMFGSNVSCSIIYLKT
jgi:hypothetical protein